MASILEEVAASMLGDKSLLVTDKIAPALMSEMRKHIKIREYDPDYDAYNNPNYKVKGKTMKCEKCGSTGETTEHPIQDGTKTALKQLCGKCAPDPVAPAEESKATTRASVPPIKPATAPRNATEAFMANGPAAALAQSPEAADAGLKTFGPEPPVPIELPTETVSPQPPDAPVPGAPVAIGVITINAKIEGYDKDIKALY